MTLRTILRDAPIRRKLSATTILAAGAALALACASFVVYDLITFRSAMVQRLGAEAEIIARQSSAPLVFTDPDSAKTTLEALSALPQVLSAAVYAADGTLFAEYARVGASAAAHPLTRAPGGWHAFSADRLAVGRAIEFDGGIVGTVVIESDLTTISARLRSYALIALCVLILSSLAGHWTASRLQRIITRPIQHLAATAHTVSTRRDYSVRAVAEGRDELGQLTIGFNHMLEEIQHRDAALRANERQYRQLFDANPNPMWVYDPETLAFLAVNEAAVRLYGYSRDEFLERTIKDIRPPEDVPVLIERLRDTAGSGGTTDGLWKHRRKDGSLLDVEIASSAIAFGAINARLVVATDVSEKKTLEVQLVQAQKMEAIGRLAGGVAHDFNNLLSVISGYSELLRKGLPSEDPGHTRVEQIQKAADRAAALTRQLLAFSRKEVIQPRLLDLNDVVADVEKMLQRLIGEDVQLVTKLAKDLGCVQADRGQLDQVILNLAINARDAMPQGGHLWIETTNVVVDEAYRRTHADLKPGAHVMLAVTDSGHGMDAATLSHVFEPFFTTKAEGKGTGLGLATVFGIVKRAGGQVSVYSEVGRGTTFRVYLPWLDQAAPANETDAVTAPPARGTETVLLVEDADALRPMIHEILDAAGYRVLESSDPEEALLRAGVHKGPLDLLLTDVVMPRMSGPELVRAVQAVRPRVRVLFMSGYTNDAIGEQGVLDPGVHFLQKPFSTDDLLGSVRAALDGARGEAEAAQLSP